MLQATRLASTEALRCPRTALRSAPTWRDFACRLRRPQKGRRRPRILPLSHVNNATIGRAKTETSLQEWSLPSMKTRSMKTLSLILAMFFLLFSAVVTRGASLTRVSNETGIPVETLQAERASTGLGWGGLEKAHLLANASGKSFDDIVALHQGGQGWGKIAHDNGLNLGKVVSSARHSGKAVSHTQKVHSQKIHGKSASNISKGHGNKMNTMRGANHGSSFRSAHTGFHGMRGDGMGHGGRGR